MPPLVLLHPFHLMGVVDRGEKAEPPYGELEQNGSCVIKQTKDDKTGWITFNAKHLARDLDDFAALEDLVKDCVDLKDRLGLLDEPQRKICRNLVGKPFLDHTAAAQEVMRNWGACVPKLREPEPAGPSPSELLAKLDAVVPPLPETEQELLLLEARHEQSLRECAEKLADVRAKKRPRE